MENIIKYFVELFGAALVLVLVIGVGGLLLWAIRRYPWRSFTEIKPLSRFRDHPLGKWTRTVRVQLMLVFAISLGAYFVSTDVANMILGRVISNASLDYSSSIQTMQINAQTVVNALQNGQITNPSQNQVSTNTTTSAGNVTSSSTSTSPSSQAATTQTASTQASFQAIVNGIGFAAQNEQIFIASPTGKVLAASSNAEETQVDIQKLTQQALNSAAMNGGGTVVLMYPMTYLGQTAYLIVQGTPNPYIVYVQRNNPLATVIGIAIFIATFYFLTRKKMRYLEELGSGLRELASGNLAFRVAERGSDELTALASNMNHMADSLDQQIEAERRAEQTKTELITNVSHDLRTPLTLIMGYLRLLKDGKYESEEQRAEFIDISYEKSEKLGNLIQDLFDYTKLANGGVPLNHQEISLTKLLDQMVEELVTVGAESEIQFVRDLPADPVLIEVDPEQMSRVFENLLLNSLQYSHRPGEIRVQLQEDGDMAVVSVTNESDPIPEEELPRLFDRFYRVDVSRTSSSGGSGLGLAIAKNVVEMHGGSIHVEQEEGEVRFIVRLPLADVNHRA